MATIEKYQISSGAMRYRVRYRTPDNRQTDKRGFKTKRDAERFAATVEVSKMRGEYVAPSLGRVTVGELGAAWLHRQRGHLKPSSYRVAEIEWRVRVAPRWGQVALGDIRPTAIQRWVSDLSDGVDGAKPVGASVVSRAHHVLSAILADAVGDRLLARNPASDIRLPHKNRKRPVYLTHQQVAELAAASGPYEGLVLLLAYTGLRWGEAIGLRVRDLDMLRRRATVSENAVQVGSEVLVGTPKAHKQRSVPLPEFLLPYLARQCERRDRDDLLFPGDDGGHLERPHSTSGWFIKAVAGSGVPRVTPRHTAASLAVSAGANVKAVQRMLGHASAARERASCRAVATASRSSSNRSAYTSNVMAQCGQNVGTRWEADPTIGRQQGADLCVYPTESATATIAEVICAISSGVQMYGGTT
jgi:integrase